jgi:hypothetical protein
MTEFEPVDWKARLDARLTDHVKRQAARRAERAEFARRRDYGLKQRYAAKARALSGNHSTQREVATQVGVSQDRIKRAEGDRP